jgi:hypothetical protein
MPARKRKSARPSPEAPEKAEPTFVHAKGSAIASWIFGSFLLLILLAIIFLLPEPSDSQRSMIRFLMALGAAFLSFFFVGGVILNGTVAGQTIGGGGGFALFILLQFLVDPFAVKTKVADAAPEVLRKDETIAVAQKMLKEAGYYAGEITGIADSGTRAAIKAFQSAKGLVPDGYLGPKTKQILSTKGPTGDQVQYEVDEDGMLKFISGWSEADVVPVAIPQLAGVAGAPASGSVRFYKGATEDLEAAFKEIEEHGLISDILSWDGAFVPRTVRGRPSIHAYGLAFDINAQWNSALREAPAVGEKGSVRRLVPVFEKHGFRWGGNFARGDPTHFQWARLEKSNSR